MKIQSATLKEQSEAIENLTKFRSIPILHGPTPVTELAAPLRVAATERLQIELNSQFSVFLKRDDLTPGFGNKTRKLEVILADVKDQGADCVITAGGPQSNHCRQTAQFGREMQLEVHLMFGTSSGRRDFSYSGNQVVDRLFDATVHVCRKSERAQAMEALSERLREEGKIPYVIPVGGSDYLGALAYAKGFLELLDQSANASTSFERIVVATSSGGTQAGLVVGARLAGWEGEIIGISIDQIPDVDEPDTRLKYVGHMSTIANQALEHLGAPTRVVSTDFKVNYDYLQDGYGVVGDYDRIGVITLANHGIIAGPVYSGRAFGAFLDLLSEGAIPDDGKTIFWHTGGAGELDVYKDDIFK